MFRGWRNVVPGRECDSNSPMKLDLNCDLGEGEPLAKTRALMRSITSANVACGGHAGSVKTMEACVRLAKQFKVQVGAHPGVAPNFGRGEISISAHKRISALAATSCGTR